MLKVLKEVANKETERAGWSDSRMARLTGGCSAQPNAIQDLEIRRRQMSDQAELADDASKNWQRFLSREDGRKDGGDHDLLWRPSVGQDDLPVGARARL